MKIRIKGASVRIRLSKSEVARLVQLGRVEDLTAFPAGVLQYAIQKTKEGEVLSADFKNNSITMFVPEKLIHNWDKNALVTIDARMPVTGSESLYLLLEKDFQCIDNTLEDQSDNYVNPTKSAE